LNTSQINSKKFLNIYEWDLATREWVTCLFFEKIKKHDKLPEELDKFTDREIQALEKLVCKSAVQFLKYGEDFRLIKSKTPKAWKWFVLVIAENQLSKKFQEWEDLLRANFDDWEDLEKLIEISKAPWKVDDYYPWITTMFDRKKKKSSPHREISYPDVLAHWWEPMTVTNYCWGTAAYPSKVRITLKEIGAKTVSKARGNVAAKYSVETNLKVMKVWLSRWEKPDRKKDLGSVMLKNICAAELLFQKAQLLKYSEERKQLEGEELFIHMLENPDEKVEPLPYKMQIIRIIQEECFSET
jgi:hypothetical protein